MRLTCAAKILPEVTELAACAHLCPEQRSSIRTRLADLFLTSLI